MYNIKYLNITSDFVYSIVYNADKMFDSWCLTEKGEIDEKFHCKLAKNINTNVAMSLINLFSCSVASLFVLLIILGISLFNCECLLFCIFIILYYYYIFLTLIIECFVIVCDSETCLSIVSINKNLKSEKSESLYSLNSRKMEDQ